jgi:hypothetical protein
MEPAGEGTPVCLLRYYDVTVQLVNNFVPAPGRKQEELVSEPGRFTAPAVDT